jgi:plasmid stabilization system protein ParE
MKLAWSPRALERASEIAQYIAEDSPDAAKLWLIEIFGVVGRLEEGPKSGRVVPEAGRDEIREILHGNYRIVYRIESKQIAVLTIRHVRQLLSMKEIKPAKKRK